MNQTHQENPTPLLEMGLLEHLGELRRRLLISLVWLIIGSCLCWNYSQLIFNWLFAPYYHSFPVNSIAGTSPASAFTLRLKMSLFGGAALISPILFHQAWSFIAPGLYNEEKRVVLPLTISSLGLFIIGVLFCYYCIVPIALSFCHEQYQLTGITPVINVDDLLSSMMIFLGGFGVVCEMPVLTFVLARAGLIDDRTLISSARYAIVIIFIIAAVLTPPDALSQILMAMPMVGLYGVSILVAKYAAKDKAPPTQKTQA